MKRGRQLKSKLRQYSSTTPTNDSTASESSTPSTTPSVTEKLTKLRIEQSRAEANRQKRYNGTSLGRSMQRQPSTAATAVDPDAPWLNPWADLVTPTIEAPSSTQASRRPARPAAGPPPPPSWTRMRSSQQQKLSSSNRRHALRQHRSLLLNQHQHQVDMVSSLVRICCCQLADYYTIATTSPDIDSLWWISQMKRFPAHIKQRILYEWSFLSNTDGLTMATAMVTDSTMDLFQKTEYEELWLEASHLSLERFIQGFWKVDLISTSTTTPTTTDGLVDNWEDLLQDDEPTTIQNDDDKNIDDSLDNTLPTFILHMDQQEEIGKWGHIYQVMKFLRPDMDYNNSSNNSNYHGTLNLPGNTSTFALSSPFLGRTLVSLNLSFMTLSSGPDSPFSWVTIAYLMVSTLPHLMWLYTAGCFDGGGDGGGDVVQGTRVLSILSHGLRKLKFWDLCYYDWLQLDLLTSVVDWRRDLLELQTLCLSSPASSSGALTTTTSSNHQKATEISRWFKEHQLSRINIIWIDL